MIHAYNEQFLEIIQPKVASLFELAVLEENINIDIFAQRFISSDIAHSLETADPIFALGKSSNELLALILNKTPINKEINSNITPEYRVGWILSYAQWYLNTTFKDIINVIPCSELLNYYFPYHEMDIMQIVDLIKSNLKRESKLKTYRKKMNLSQLELSNLSNVPLRTIRSYEQETTDIAKAEAETLYLLSQVLKCSIEDLIK